MVWKISCASLRPAIPQGLTSSKPLPPVWMTCHEKKICCGNGFRYSSFMVDRKTQDYGDLDITTLLLFHSPGDNPWFNSEAGHGHLQQ